MTTLTARDREYLRAFPITDTLTGFYGPTIPAMVLDEQGYHPLRYDDDDCWWATTTTGAQIPVPMVIVDRIRADNGGQYVWSVDFSQAADREQRQALMAQAMEHLRIRVNTLAAELARWTPEAGLIESAWGIIANAGGGNWDRETAEWRGAAERWRNEFHAWLHANRPD